MWHKSNLAGTTKNDFQLGRGTEYGVDRDGENLRLRDAEIPAQRISDLLGWKKVKAGTARTILADFSHCVSSVVIEDTGVLEIQDGGDLVLV